MKVLKRYKTPLGFQYDVRSLHSWGLPRKGIPQDRLKVNPAGSSVLESLHTWRAPTSTIMKPLRMYVRVSDRVRVRA